MTDIWYPITHTDPLYPSPLVQVRGIVSINNSFDAQIIISRGKPPLENTWAEWIRNKPVPLGKQAIPRLWQPQFPALWKSALPSPASVSETRMWSATMSFQSVEDAEAAELARDMERDRQMARDAISDPILPKESGAWWRDATRIRYEQPGSITKEMAEGRIMRAVAHCGKGEGLTIPVSSFSAILARMAEKKEQYREVGFSDIVHKLQAFPQDHQDFLQAMSWFVALDPPCARQQKPWAFATDQRILMWRSLDVPLSWDVIAHKIGKTHHEYARKEYDRIIVRVAAIANANVGPADDLMKDLRERNRAAKQVA